MVDLERVHTFLIAAEQLNFSEAAKRLHLSQPTVSHHIKGLEASMGVELFDRQGHALRLTEAGRLMLPWARKLVYQALEMQELMGSFNEEIAGHLRIACSTTAGKYILPQMAARFTQRHPNIRVSVLGCLPEGMMLQLMDEEANLGVVSSYDLCGNEFECQEFFSDTMALYVAAGHPWAQRERIEPAELMSEPFIIREATSGTRRVMLTELAKHDITLDDLQINLEIGNAEAIVRTVQAGFGVSFVSTLAAAWAHDQGLVKQVQVEGLELNRIVYMMRRTFSVPNRVQEVFWNFVHDPANQDLLNLPQQFAA